MAGRATGVDCVEVAVRAEGVAVAVREDVADRDAAGVTAADEVVVRAAAEVSDGVRAPVVDDAAEALADVLDAPATDGAAVFAGAAVGEIARVTVTVSWLTAGW